MTPGIRRVPRIWQRHPLRTLLLLTLAVVVIFVTVRLFSFAVSSNDQLYVRIGNQQPAFIDLHQGLPISPYMLGTNVFPEAGSNSLDKPGSGFMNYGPSISNGLHSAHIKLLRFPGGNWGDTHTFSQEQLNSFTNLLAKTDADGMIQVQVGNLSGQHTYDLAAQINQAVSVVDYMNNEHNADRTAKYAHASFRPIKFWTVGNEPDRLENPSTGEKFTVAEYVQIFIKFSLAMHEKDPHIQIFGPEVSQFYGARSGPFDTKGQLWMEGFLKGVGDYERTHPQLAFHLLDGVSFHRYQFDDAHLASALLMSSTNEWNYLIAELRQSIAQSFERELPIAVTEINTNPGDAVPTRGFAALWWADTLGMLMSQRVTYSAFFATEGVEAPYPLFSNYGNVLHETAMLRAMQLFSHLQSNFVPLDIQRTPVSVYATQDDAHQTVGLLFINKSNHAQLAQVVPQSSLLGNPWPHLDVSMKEYSMTVIALHRDGGAEAYSYIVPTGTNAEAAPLLHTICAQGGTTLVDNKLC
ncbi:MAG: hypothetical protein NVS2B12_01570 [Ktedonobacteraceae bacterium]